MYKFTILLAILVICTAGNKLQEGYTLDGEGDGVCQGLFYSESN